MSYHNTTNQSGAVLTDYEMMAQTQDRRIFNHLRKWPETYFTAEWVHAAVLSEAPLTSVRRALTNLYKRGLIEQGEQVTGGYGRPVFTWRYKQEVISRKLPDIQPAGASIPPLIQVNEKYAIKYCEGRATPFAICSKTKKSEEYPDGWRKVQHHAFPYSLLISVSMSLLNDARIDTSKPVSARLQQIRRVIKRIEGEL